MLTGVACVQVHGSGRHPVADEATLWEEGLDLWTPETFLPSNESTDGTKLQGTFSFPFKLRIPGTTIATSAQDGQRRLRSTPPSFVLSGNANDPSVSRGTEWGSVRYYVKVTLGRKGLLKVSSRRRLPLSNRV